MKTSRESGFRRIESEVNVFNQTIPDSDFSLSSAFGLRLSSVLVDPWIERVGCRCEGPMGDSMSEGQGSKMSVKSRHCSRDGLKFLVEDDSDDGLGSGPLRWMRGIERMWLRKKCWKLRLDGLESFE
jgi:hypothetical protein